MAVSVNTNIPSLNAQRNLARSGSMLAKSLERLSSGLRINRASDDAAGLAISEGLRSQVRGLNQAVRNANDGISLLSTAESALDETNNMLQRMRELAVQSASDTNSSTNRASIQLEMDQLVEEMTRIGNTVSFNGQNLLDGTFTQRKIQIGASANQTLSLSIDDLRASSLGAVAIRTAGAATAVLASGDVQINGVAIGASSADGISYQATTFSALAIATAINAQSGTSAVTARVNANVQTAVTTVDAMTLGDGTESLTINGVDIGTVTVSALDADGALRDAINSRTNVTGVAATLDASNQLVLTAADGRNITVNTAGSIGEELGFTTVVADDIADVNYVGTYTLVSDATFAVSGTAPGDAGLTAASTTVDGNTAVNTVSVSSSANAAAAIMSIDNALRQVSSSRSGLGAMTNRMESTVSNLRTVAENLAASDSRIRDADFAYETAELTKAQILQQAGTAILAQANMTPQAALSLL